MCSESCGVNIVKDIVNAVVITVVIAVIIGSSCDGKENKSVYGCTL